MKFKKIRKRDGRIEESKVEKITNAIAKNERGLDFKWLN